MYTTVQKVLFKRSFLKEGPFAHQSCIFYIKNTVKKRNIVKYYYNLK